MDAAGGSGLGRSTNHRTIRPASPQRSRHLALNSSYREQGGRERRRGSGLEVEGQGRGEGSGGIGKERKSGCSTPSSPIGPPMVGDSVSPPRARCEPGAGVQSYREIANDKRCRPRGVGPFELSSQRSALKRSLSLSITSRRGRFIAIEKLPLRERHEETRYILRARFTYERSILREQREQSESSQ